MADLIAKACRVPGLELEIDTATQYATAYLDGRPFATVRRRHAFDPRTDPPWRAWDVTGRPLASRLSAQGIVRAVEIAAQNRLWPRA